MATQIHHLWSQRLGDNKLLAHPGTYFVLSRKHRRERKELDSFLPKGSDHIAHGGGTFGNGNWCPLPAGFLAKLGGCINLAFGFAKQCKGRSKTTCLKYTWGHAPGQKWCWWGYRCMASQEETGPQQFSTATKSPGKEQWYWWLNQIYIESCQGCCMLHLWISESHGAVQLMAFSMPRCPWVSLCHYVWSDGNFFVPHVAEGTSKVWHKTQKTYNRMYAST